MPHHLKENERYGADPAPPLAARRACICTMTAPGAAFPVLFRRHEPHETRDARSPLTPRQAFPFAASKRRLC